MAITGKNPKNIEWFYVTYPWTDYKNKIETTYEVIKSLKEIQSEIQGWNRIKKIEKAIITKGEEVDIEYIKPEKYKGKPYTYKEKYGDKQMTVNENIKHKPLWTSVELEIVYKWYDKKTIAEIKEMLPNRTLSAVKNKVKQIKFGKYKKGKGYKYGNRI